MSATLEMNSYARARTVRRAIEIGHWLGRAPRAMTRSPFRKRVGIELSKALSKRARANVRRLRGRRAPAEVIAGDAAFVDCAERTAFYLVQPFGDRTMRIVLARVHESVRANPRRVRLLYVNPVHEDVFDAARWLTKTGTLAPRVFDTHASLWEHVPPAEARP